MAYPEITGTIEPEESSNKQKQRMQIAEALTKAPHAALFSLREQVANPAQQIELAPLEHRAFAREVVAENPLMAISLLFGIPAYQVAKRLGLRPNATPASQEQLIQGYKGLGEGLMRWWSNGRGQP